MSIQISERVNLTDFDEIHSLTGHDPEDVKSASSSVGTTVTSEEVAREMKQFSDPLIKQIE